MRQRVLGGAVLLGVSASISYALILNLCHAVFACGCRSWWTGAAEMCNVNQAGVRHCPWCSVGEAGFQLAFGLLLAPQIVLSFWPARWRWTLRAPVVLAMFPLAGTIVALGYGLWLGYWR